MMETVCDSSTPCYGKSLVSFYSPLHLYVHHAFTMCLVWGGGMLGQGLGGGVEFEVILRPQND